MSSPNSGDAISHSTKLLVVLLALAWGMSWLATAIGLHELPPWTFRFSTTSIGAITLFLVAGLTGHQLAVPKGQRIHVMIAGFANVVVFNVASAQAQVSGSTTRTIMIAYSMPIWAALLSAIMLRQRLDARRWAALALCAAGLAIVIYPQARLGFSPAILYALACAIGWAYATVHLRWANTKVPPLANATWQLAFGACTIGAGAFLFEGVPHLWPLQTPSILAVLYVGLLGVGLAHFLWWSIADRVTPVTASIGVLLVPVVGIASSTLFLGDRPSLMDMVGFLLIFAAAATVLLQPSARR